MVNIDGDGEVGGVQNVAAHVLELKLKALILDTIHNIEVIDQLSEANLRDVNDWMWQKQLR